MPEEKSAPLLQEQLCFALYATSRAFTKVYAKLLADMGVTYPQYLVLLALWETDGLTVQKIADRLEIEGATATPLIKRMEKLNLVSRQRCAEDERRVLVRLTDLGQSHRQKAMAIPEALGCISQLSTERANRLIADLNEIRRHILETE